VSKNNPTYAAIAVRLLRQLNIATTQLERVKNWIIAPATRAQDVEKMRAEVDKALKEINALEKR
jgi:chaperonin cofactor prefoldin